MLRPHRVDREPRAGGLDPPDLRLDGHAHDGRARALADPLHVLHVRLPRAVRADVGAVRRRRVRDGQGGRPDGRRDPHRPRRRPRRADRRRARLAAGARRGHDPAARGDALARPGGAPERLRAGPAAVGRPALRAVGLRLVVPGRRRAADRHRLLRPPLPRQGADRAARRGRGRRHRPLPGQLDPPPLPRPRRGRRVLLRRLRRALPGDERRGDPHGLVLRDRRRARARAGPRGRAHARARRSSATPRSPRSTAGSSSGCGSTSAPCATCTAGRWTGWRASPRARA